MRFNRHGQIAHGNEFGSAVSIDGVPIGSGSAHTWINDRFTVRMRSEDAAVAQYDSETGESVLLDARGGNTIKAGGGVWAASKVGVGLYASTGFSDPGGFLLDVGPDGAIAYTPHAGFPVCVREQSGGEWTLSDSPVRDLQLLGNGRAVWYSGGQFHGRGVVIATPSGEIGRPRVCTAGVRDYVLAHNGLRGLVIYPADDPTQGIIVPGVDPWFAFAYDIRAVNHRTVEVVWFTGEGELPSDLRRVTVDVLAGPFVSLASTHPPITSIPVTPTPAPAPVPVPPSPIPTPPEPVMPELPESLEAAVRAERAKYPAVLTIDQPAKILNAVAWAHREQGWGLSVKPSGHRVPAPQGVDVAYDILHHKPTNTLWGCFTDELRATVNWGQEEHHRNGDRPWLAPMDPTGIGGAPVPQPGGGSAPTEPGVPCNCQAQVDALRAEMEAVLDMAAQDVVGLLERIVALEQRKVELPKLRARGELRLTLARNQNVDIPVVAVE